MDTAAGSDIVTLGELVGGIAQGGIETVAGTVKLDLGETTDGASDNNEFTLTGDITAYAMIDIDTGAGADVVTVNGTMTATTDMIDIDSGAGVDEITVTGTMTTDAAAIAINTGSDSDQFTVKGLIKAQTNVTLDTAAGSDIVTLGELVGGIAQGGIETVAGTVKLDLGETTDGASDNDQFTLIGDITSNVDIDFDSGAGADVVTVNGTMTTTTGAIDINTGSESDQIDIVGRLEAGTSFKMHTGSGEDDLEITGAIKSSGTSIEIDTGDTRDFVTITGDLEAETDVLIKLGAGDDSLDILNASVIANNSETRIEGEAGKDTIIIEDVAQLTGTTSILGGNNDDTITIVRLATQNAQTDSLLIDGGSGADDVFIQTWGSIDGVDKNYNINVWDTGAANDGSDTLDILGTAKDDFFLSREKFVALLHGTESQIRKVWTEAGDNRISTVERINYDRSMDGRVSLLGFDGKDHFVSDDNSAIMTFDGGKGDDTFQFGQIFGLDPRVANPATNGIAAGDEINAVLTTRGYLSRGVSFSSVAMGGEGADLFTIYSNKASIKLEGEAGNDSFVVRAFLLASGDDTAEDEIEISGGDGDDSVKYNINAPVKIDGGAGFDTVVVVGTEADDSFVVTENGVYGAGLNIEIGGAAESIEVDGVEGDDNFFILSTPKDAVTHIIGGLGSDQFHVTGDVTETIFAADVGGRSGLINHQAQSVTGNAYNNAFIPGVGVTVADANLGKVLISQEVSGDATEGVTRVFESNGGTTDIYSVALAVSPVVGKMVYVTVSAARSSTSDQEEADRPLMQQGTAVSFVADGNVITRANGSWLDDGFDEFQSVVIGDAGDNNGVYEVATVTETQITFVADARLATTEADLTAITIEGQKASSILVRESGSGAEFTDATVLTFDSTNWDQAQTVEVRAQDDAAEEGVREVVINHSVMSDDDNFDAALVEDLHVTVFDDDQADIVIWESGTDTRILEGSVSEGISDTWDVRLTRKPTHDVTVDLTDDSNSTDVVLSANTVTFDSTNWDQVQTITVSSPVDAFEENLERVTVSHTATSSDLNFNGARVAEILVRVEDGDTAGAYITETGGRTLIVDGGTDTSASQNDEYKIRLRKQPTAEVKVHVYGDGQTLPVAGAGVTIEDIASTTLSADFQSVQDDNDLIVRAAGSWIDDGFLAGQTLRVSGTSSNNKTMFISDISDDEKTIVLATGSNVTDEATSADFLVKAGVVTFNAQNWYQEVTVSLEPDPDFEPTATSYVTKKFAAEPHTTSKIQGSLIIDGGVTAPRTLVSAVMLPSEQDTGPIDVDVSDNEAFENDRVYVHNDGSQANDTGEMKLVSDVPNKGLANVGTDAVLINGLGMSTGQITFNEGTDDAPIMVAYYEGIAMRTIEIIEVMLGKGDDNFTVTGNNAFSDNTQDVPITAIHGGGGGDTITIKDGDLSNPPETYLVVYGDTSADGSRYNYLGGAPNGGALVFDGLANPDNHNDTIDASAYSGGATGGLVLFGGVGDDTIRGSQGADHIAGGSGDDDIHGNSGDDHIYGDGGFNVDLLTRTLTVAVEVDEDPKSEAVDTLNPGNDTIEGNDGVDIIFGDLGRIDQVAGTIRIANTGFVERIISTETGLGGNDDILGGRDIDYIIGGAGDDTVDGGADNNIVFGDAGDIQINILNGTPQDIAQLASVSGDVGGSDSIVALYGDDIFIGGPGADVIDAGNGNNIILGDAGVITATNAGELWAGRDDIRVGEIATSYGLVDGVNPDGIDRITTGLGMDIILGGGSGDTIITNEGESALTPDQQNIVLGDYGRLVWSGQGSNPLELVTSEDTEFGGADEIITGLQRDIVIGGADGDTIDAGSGENVIFGDSGRMTFNQSDAFKGVDPYDSSGEEFSIISVNFGSQQKPVSGQAGADTSASDTGMIAPRSDQWIEALGPVGKLGRTTDTKVFDDAGNWLQGIKVEWKTESGRAMRTLTNRLGTPAGEDDQGLFASSLSASKTKAVLVIDGMDAHFDEYDIYVYSDGSSRTTTQKIEFSGGQTYTLQDTKGQFTGNYVPSSTTTGAGDVGNYVVGKALSGDSQLITLSTETRRGAAIISGIQIVGRMKPVDHAETLAPTHGGDDYIRAYSDRDVVFGGVGDDVIEVQGDRDASMTDSDFVIGDLGYMTFAADMPVFNDNDNQDTGGTDSGPVVEDMEGTSILSFNFGQNPMDANDQAGVLQSASTQGLPAPRAANWNALQSSSGTIASGIETDAGVALENLSIEWRVNNGEGSNTSKRLSSRYGLDGDRSLWSSNLQANGHNQSITVRVTGLGNHYESYDAYVYTDLNSKQMDRRTRVVTTKVDVGSANTYFLRDDRSVFKKGRYVQSDSTTPNRPGAGNYVVATDLQDDALEITISIPNGKAKAALAGLQIVGLELLPPPDPTPDPVGSDPVQAPFVFFDDVHQNIVTFASTTTAEAGLTYDDTILTGNGEDVVIGGLGSDLIDTGARGPFDNLVEAITERDVVKTSINFSDGDSKTQISAAASAGIVEDDAWNNLDLLSREARAGNQHAFMETSDGLRVDMTGGFGFTQQGASAPDSENERLVNGGLYTVNSRQMARIEVSNISEVHGDEAYDLYFYTSEDASLIKVKDATLAERAAERLDMDVANEEAGVYVIRNLTGDVLWFELGSLGRGRSAQLAILEGVQIVSGVNRGDVAYGGDRDSDAVLGDEGKAWMMAGVAYAMASQNTLDASTTDGADTIWLGDNGDFAIGGDGADWISGEAGADMILGDNGRLVFTSHHTDGWGDGHEVKQPEKRSRRTSSFDPWTVSGVELTAPTAGAGDTIIGGADNDVMYGQGGGDHYIFAGYGLGADSVIEADGNGQSGLANDEGDLLDFRHFSGPVSMSLQTASKQRVNVNPTDSNRDSFVTLYSTLSVEDVIGSEYGDWISGNVRDNLILGLGGDDNITTKHGYDLVDAGSGDDIVNRPASRVPGTDWGTKVILGGSGADVIYGSITSDLIDAGDGDDQIYLTDSVRGRATPAADLVFGGLGDDVFYLGRSTNADTTLVGNDGDDGVIASGSRKPRRGRQPAPGPSDHLVDGHLDSGTRDSKLEAWLNDHVSNVPRTDLSISSTHDTDLTQRLSGISSDRQSPLKPLFAPPGASNNYFSNFASSFNRTDDPIDVTNSMYLAIGRLRSGEDRLTSIPSNDIVISVRKDQQPRVPMQRHYAYDPETGEFEQVDTVSSPADYVPDVSAEIGNSAAPEDSPFAFVDKDGGLWLTDPDHLEKL